MAMSRLPTRMSDGKANLHQGAVGVGVRMSDGITSGGVLGNSLVDEHPDTGEIITGFQMPAWEQMMSPDTCGMEIDQSGFEAPLTPRGLGGPPSDGSEIRTTWQGLQSKWGCIE